MLIYLLIPLCTKKIINAYFNILLLFFCDRRAVKNIFDLLRPGGDLLVCFIANNPIYSIYERMMKRSKWKQYMQDAKKYISPYYFCDSPVKEFANILSEAGFDCDLCETVERGYTFPNFKVLKRKLIYCFYARCQRLNSWKKMRTNWNMAFIFSKYVTIRTKIETPFPLEPIA